MVERVPGQVWGSAPSADGFSWPVWVAWREPYCLQLYGVSFRRLGRLHAGRATSFHVWAMFSAPPSCWGSRSFLTTVNEIVVTRLPLHRHGCCSSLPTCGTWQPRYLMAPESGFSRLGRFLRLPCRASGWTASRGPARSSTWGGGPLGRPAHDWHTLTRLCLLSLLPPLQSIRRSTGKNTVPARLG